MVRVNHRQTAEDLVQETFVAAFRSQESFRGGSSEKTWLVAILKNKIIDHYRKRDVLKDAQSYLADTEDEFSSSFFNVHDGHWKKDAYPQPWSESADASVDREEFSKAVQGCIAKMPPKLMPIFVARFFDEEDSETICKVHKISPSNYWVIIHRAKVLFRSCIEKNWFSNLMK